MFVLICLVNLCEVLTLVASFPQIWVSSTQFVSHVIDGFKDFPLVVWTTGRESFPNLAEVLITESQKQARPVELWQRSHSLSRPSLKFAAGKSFYTLFPPTLVEDRENFMMQMLENFTACKTPDEVFIEEQINDSIFLFLSRTYATSLEDPSFMQKNGEDYCYTPPHVLFVKYSSHSYEKLLIELESLRAVRMRCGRKEGYACNELVTENNSLQVLSYLSSGQVKNLIQVQWRKTYSTPVFLSGLGEVFQEHEMEWESLKAVFLNRSFRDLSGFGWKHAEYISIFELIADVNITVIGVRTDDKEYFHIYVVGYISNSCITKTYESGLSLRTSIHFLILYGADYTTGFNLTAKRLFGACGKLELLIIFGLVVLIASLRIKRYRLKDLIKSFISTLAPLISHSCPYKLSRLKALYYIWMLSVWFSTVMYLSLLQSQRIAPSLQVGNETFEDLENREMSFFASYRALRYVIDESRWDQGEDPNSTFSRLTSIIHRKPIWKMTGASFRNFFALTTWAYVAEAIDVEPIIKVLTKAYSKTYDGLPEKIHPQLEWSLISIPQGQFVIESLKEIKESGIWAYWFQTYLSQRKIGVETRFRDMLLGKSIFTEVSDEFKPLNMADSLPLEITALIGLIIIMLTTSLIVQLEWLRLKEWTQSKVIQMIH